MDAIDRHGKFGWNVFPSIERASAASAALFGTPFESLADWAAQRKAEEAAAKVVSFADMREKLRPHRVTTET
jgi:hypothetical protein